MPELLPLKILGTGHYLPQRVVSSAEVAELCTVEGLTAEWIDQKTGVVERRWCEDYASRDTNSFMAAEAAKMALANAGLAVAELDLLINASASWEQAVPDGGPFIQRRLGEEARGLPCFTVHATCLSFLVALDMAASLLASGRYERILIVSSETTSAVIDLNEPESATLFGDGAAAAVVGRTPAGEQSGIHRARLETYAEGVHLTELPGLGTRKHPLHGETTDYDYKFHMDGPKVYMMAHRLLPAFLERLQPGLSQGLGDDIAWVIPHQASILAVRSMRKYGIPEERIVLNLHQYGNVVSASLPLALHDVISDGRLRRGDKALLIGTGAGLSLGGLIFTY